MPHFRPLIAALVLACSIQQANAQADAISDVPTAAIFVVSSGMWEQEQTDAEPQPGAATNEAAREPVGEPTRGYYKVVAMRQSNGTARIFLQQVAYTADGPRLVETIELEEFSQMNVYVTDIRPESSSGAAGVPGLFVTVYLKTDPMAQQPDSWTVMIDELGDMKIERASN